MNEIFIGCKSISRKAVSCNQLGGVQKIHRLCCHAFFFLFFPWPPPCTSRSRLKKSACSAGCFNVGLIFSILEMLLCFIHVHVFIWIARSVNEQDFHWLQMHFQKSSQSQLISGHSANSQALLTGVFFPFFFPCPPPCLPLLHVHLGHV